MAPLWKLKSRTETIRTAPQANIVHPHLFSAYRSRIHSIKLTFWQILLGVLNSHKNVVPEKFIDSMIREARICILYQIAHSTEEARRWEIMPCKSIVRIFLFFHHGLTFTQDFSLDLLVEWCDRHWVLLERHQAPCTNKNNSCLFHASIFITFLHLNLIQLIISRSLGNRVRNEWSPLGLFKLWM